MTMRVVCCGLCGVVYQISQSVVLNFCTVRARKVAVNDAHVSKLCYHALHYATVMVIAPVIMTNNLLMFCWCAVLINFGHRIQS